MSGSKATTMECSQEYSMLSPIGIKLQRLLLPLLLMGSDYFALVVAGWTAYIIRADILPRVLPWPFQHFDISWTYIYIAVPFSYLFFAHFDRLYTRRLLLWQHVEKLFKISIYAMILVIVLMYFTGAAKEISRIFIGAVWLTSFAFLVISQYAAKRILAATGFWQIPVVLVGAGKTAELLINAFENDVGLGYKVVGLIEDKLDPALGTRYPLIGTFSKAEEALSRTGVRDVLIAAPGLARKELLSLVYRLQPYVNNITFVPDLFGVPVGDMELDTLFNEKAVLLRIRNNLANEYNRILKSTFDYIASFFGLVFGLPLVAFISLLIYIDNPGPVIFAHNRIGKKGRVFPCYKFRSMITNAQEALDKYLQDNPAAREEWAKDFKLKNDPRVTRLGSFLRRTSLDELPQLFNVIKGEMSLVGPRPIVQAEVEKYQEYINDYYLVKPGITGLWQVSGRNDIEYSDRVKLDSWYIRNWSYWLDIIILLKTVGVVLGKKGAY